MVSTSKIAVSAAPIQNRRVMLRNSESSSTTAAPALYRGSSAMPQMGQAPGLSETTSGCIGQKYSTVGTPTTGSNAIPHFQQGPGLSELTSGSMGQMYFAVLLVKAGGWDCDGVPGNAAACCEEFDLTCAIPP